MTDIQIGVLVLLGLFQLMLWGLVIVLFRYQDKLDKDIKDTNVVMDWYVDKIFASQIETNRASSEGEGYEQ